MTGRFALQRTVREADAFPEGRAVMLEVPEVQRLTVTARPGTGS